MSNGKRPRQWIASLLVALLLLMALAGCGGTSLFNIDAKFVGDWVVVDGHTVAFMVRQDGDKYVLRSSSFEQAVEMIDHVMYIHVEGSTVTARYDFKTDHLVLSGDGRTKEYRRKSSDDR